MILGKATAGGFPDQIVKAFRVSIRVVEVQTLVFVSGDADDDCPAVDMLGVFLEGEQLSPEVVAVFG